MATSAAQGLVQKMIARYVDRRVVTHCAMMFIETSCKLILTFNTIIYNDDEKITCYACSTITEYNLKFNIILILIIIELF